jgi:CBS domain-containing protein
MVQSIRDVMTPQPTAMSKTSSVLEAARAMRDSNIGGVIVMDNGRVCGIVTDRDIVVRVVADERDLTTTRLADVCSQELTTGSPDDGLDDAIQLMRHKAIQRLPVVEGGTPVGIVSIGDLAVTVDRQSALGDISAATPNR